MFSIRARVIGLGIFLLVILGAFAVMQPNDTTATLVVAKGQAVVDQSGGALLAGAAETAVAAGEVITVKQGDTIRLSDTATAQLRLRDGSTLDLDNGTTLIITELVMNNDSFRARFNQLTGRTINQVVRLLKPGDAFEIKTPSSTASVRGTMFLVEVRSLDEVHYAVTEGVVQVTMGDQAVDVAAGFQVTAVVGQRLQVVPFEATTNIPTINATAGPTSTLEPIGDPTVPPTTTVETAVPTQDNPLPENTAPVNQPTRQTPDDPTDDGTTDPDDSPEGGSTPSGQPDPNPQDDPVNGSPPASSPTGTPINPPTNTPTLPLTSTPAPPPTNTPAPLPTNTPVPLPTNTPVPPPTNTPDAEDMVTICHNGTTIQVSASAVDAHLAHGDTLGPCP